MENGNHFRHKIESQRIRLADAITSGRLYQTKMILTDFTDLNYLDSEGLSPLMRAFTIDDSKYRTRRAMVKLLLDHKVDVNLRDNNGRTVLHSACKVNKLDLVQLLLEKCLQDVDITSQDTQGNTPLIYAVMNNNMHMVNLLVGALKKFSLSVDQRNNEDKTAYLRALEMGFKECASILAQVGNASQNTRVNPFLDFLPGATNQDARGKTRSRSAPLPKDYDHKRQLSTHPREVLVNRAYECVNDSLFLGNTRNMNRNKMFFKTRKTHSTTSQKASKIPKTKREFDKNYQSSVIFGGDKLQYTTKPKCVPGKTLSKTSTGEKGSVTKKKHRLLSLLLNESGSPTTIVRHSSRSGVSNTSCNQVVNEPLDTPTKASSRKENAPTVDGNVIGKQARVALVYNIVLCFYDFAINYSVTDYRPLTLY